MASEQDFTRFVAIGGLGGSGTRVVALILQKMGFYLGPALNPQLDNILFTLLFKRRDWIDAFPTDVEIDRMIGIFTAAMQDGVEQAFDKLAPGEAEQLFEKTRKLGVVRTWFEKILSSPPPNPKEFSGLAWKEPNTHVFLPQLMRRLPNMKYIHVMRNGLDMAVSGNRQQLNNWCARYGFEADADKSSAKAQLQFWLTVNRGIIEIGKGMGPDQFLLQNYDDLCADFESQIDPLQDFLGRQLSDTDKAYFTDHIGSSSIGRFRQAPENTFSAAEREAVRQLGFCVH